MTEPRQIVGNYEFLGVVDKPKAGVTYKVRNLTTGEFEALRTLPGASHGDPESVERLFREIRIHTRLSHPNIVAFHDALELDGRLVMTAEFVEGTTLAELCSRGPLPPDQAMRTVCAVLSGLEEAHALGIVHRGITAEHVMVTRDGEIKLGGFGLAKPAADVNLTRAGAVLGDPKYISPEQVTGVGALDGRSDLYSVGVLLFYALTGKLPFTGANDFDIMVAQVSAQPPRPASLNPGIKPELELVILTALAKKPAERFAGAAEFRLALEELNGVVRPSTQPVAVADVVLEALSPHPVAPADAVLESIVQHSVASPDAVLEAIAPHPVAPADAVLEAIAPHPVAPADVVLEALAPQQVASPGAVPEAIASHPVAPAGAVLAAIPPNPVAPADALPEAIPPHLLPPPDAAPEAIPPHLLAPAQAGSHKRTAYILGFACGAIGLLVVVFVAMRWA